MTENRGQQDNLVISLFGEFKYQITGGGFQSLKSRKSEAVLLALALSGDTGMSRNAFVQMLWPDLKPDRARAGLRQALSRIRSLSPHVFITPRSGWTALSRAHVKCDLWELNACLQNRELTEANCPAAPLLTLFPYPTPAFEDWVISQKRVILRTLRGHLDAGIKDSQTPAIFRDISCRALSVLTQTDESHIETILSFYLDKKDYAQYALKRRAYIQALDKQLGLKPSVQFLNKYTESVTPQTAARYGPYTSKPPPDFVPPTLAIVEKFRLINATDQQSYLAQAVPEDITHHLTRQEWFDVKALNPEHTNISNPDDAACSHAYLVDGSLRFTEKQIAVSVRLTRQASGKILWSHIFEALNFDHPGRADNRNSLIKTVDIISETLLTKMIESIADYAATIPDEIPAADWVNTLKARRLFWQTSKENNQKAKILLQPIIEKNTAPLSALYTASFTRLLSVWSCWENDGEEEMRDARHIAEKAVRLYPADPWSHFALATCFCAMRQHKDSLRTIEYALSLHDSFSTGIGLRGHIKVFCGDAGEGREDLLTAIMLNPADPHLGIWQNSLGIAAFLDGEYEQALDWVRKAQSANSYWMQNYVVLVCAHSALGNLEEAKRNFDSLIKLTPNFSRQNWLYSHPFGDQKTQDVFLKHLTTFGF